MTVQITASPITRPNAAPLIEKERPGRIGAMIANQAPHHKPPIAYNQSQPANGAGKPESYRMARATPISRVTSSNCGISSLLSVSRERMNVASAPASIPRTISLYLCVGTCLDSKSRQFPVRLLLLLMINVHAPCGLVICVTPCQRQGEFH
jgi:hypothetical protein